MRWENIEVNLSNPTSNGILNLGNELSKYSYIEEFLQELFKKVPSNLILEFEKYKDKEWKKANYSNFIKSIKFEFTPFLEVQELVTKKGTNRFLHIPLSKTLENIDKYPFLLKQSLNNYQTGSYILDEYAKVSNCIYLQGDHNALEYNEVLSSLYQSKGEFELTGNILLEILKTNKIDLTEFNWNDFWTNLYKNSNSKIYLEYKKVRKGICKLSISEIESGNLNIKPSSEKIGDEWLSKLVYQEEIYSILPTSSGYILSY